VSKIECAANHFGDVFLVFFANLHKIPIVVRPFRIGKSQLVLPLITTVARATLGEVRNWMETKFSILNKSGRALCGKTLLPCRIWSAYCLVAVN
jgi:hypothetical protein